MRVFDVLNYIDLGKPTLIKKKKLQKASRKITRCTLILVLCKSQESKKKITKERTKGAFVQTTSSYKLYSAPRSLFQCTALLDSYSKIIDRITVYVDERNK